MNTTTKKSRSAAGYLALMILGVACTPVNERDGLSVEATGWTVQRSVTKPIENYTFIFPEEGFAYAHRDSLVDACMAAIRRNMAMLEVDTFSVPYKIRFYPSKAAMKEATAYANKIAQEENDMSLEGVKKSGKTAVYVPTKEERLAFKKAMAPVHSKMADRVGKDLLQSIYKETGFDPNTL